MKTIIHVKTDPTTKTQAQKLAKKLGLNLSIVINASLKQFIINQSLFLSQTPTMSAQLENTLKQAEKDFRKGRVSPVFTTAKAAIAYLDS